MGSSPPLLTPNSVSSGGMGDAGFPLLARLPPPPPPSRTGANKLVRATSIEVSPEMSDFVGGVGNQEDVEDLGVGLGLNRLGFQLQRGTNNTKLNAKEEGSWRRHMSLELEPLEPLVAPVRSCCSGTAPLDRGLGKSVSVQDLIQRRQNSQDFCLSSPTPSSSSDSPLGFHCSQDSSGGRGEDDLFISDRDTERQGFDFLSSQGNAEPKFTSELLRTGARTLGSNQSLTSGHTSSPSTGSTELLNTPHVRLK